MHEVLPPWLEELSEEMVIDQGTSVGEQGRANIITIGVRDDSLISWDRNP